MKNLRNSGAIWVAAAALALLFMFSMIGLRPEPSNVYAAVITPVAQTARGEPARIAEFFDVRVITADTRVCFDLADMELMDLQYQVDATTANTTSVTLQQTNIDPTSGPFNTA